MTFDRLFRNERPIVAKRGVHLDLKGLPPTADRFVELLSVFAAARYNVVLIEWEDSFPWAVDERFRSETAYTPDDILHFRKTACDLGLELIPLVQCLGHTETPLSVPGYEQLREIPDDSSVLNPLAAGARDLIQEMVDDVLNLMPDVRHFHLGGDEAWTMGKHPDTKAYIDEHGKGALYLQHVEPILDSLNARGVRPILWHDMMINWDSDALKSLAGKCDLLTWGYSGHPDTTNHHFNTKYIKRFHDHGITQWGGTAYKGADGHNGDLPNIGQREENAQAWADIAQRFGYVGVIATAWSRYTTNSVLCEPIDAALDSLVNIGVILHDGRPPDGGIEPCIAALEELGERDRFEACKAAMEHLAEVRRRGWQAVQSLREQMVLSRTDARRSTSGRKSRGLERLGNMLKESEGIAEEVRRVFAKFVEPIWIKEYLNTRLTPLRDELSALSSEADT
jgi:hexosaminidase